MSRAARPGRASWYLLAIDKVHGKLSGLKANQVKRLSNLYRRRVPAEQAATAELARAMGELALEFARPVSVLIDRRGRVVTVAAGDAADTPLPPTAGEAEARLRGLRLLHVHLKPTGLSPADLTTLFLHRLDMLVAVDVAANERGDVVLGAAHVAMVAPPTSDEEDWLIDPPVAMRDLEHDDALRRIAALEEELARSWRAREVRRGSEERAVIVGIDTGEGEAEAEARLDELAELVRSAGAVVATAACSAAPAPTTARWWDAASSTNWSRPRTTRTPTCWCSTGS